MKSLAEKFTKPLRPIWYTPESRFFSDEPLDFSDSGFFPVICLSASIPITSPEMQLRNGYTYIQGSGDDHETWSQGLSPRLFWQNHEEIMEAGRAECENAVLEVVARSKKLGRGSALAPSPLAGIEEISFTRIGDTNLYVGNIHAGLIPFFVFLLLTFFLSFGVHSPQTD